MPYKKFETLEILQKIRFLGLIGNKDSGWVGNNKKWNHFAPGDATRHKAKERSVVVTFAKKCNHRH